MLKTGSSEQFGKKLLEEMKNKNMEEEEQREEKKTFAEVRRWLGNLEENVRK